MRLFPQPKRSKDGFLFESLGKIEGQWNTLEPVSYDFLDELANLGTNYYRLLQVDNNGKITYSEVRKIEIAEQFDPGQLTISYYPNPSMGLIKLEANQSFSDFELFVFDSKGALVMKRDGVHSNIELDLSVLDSGTYTLSLKDRDQQIVSSQNIVITE